MINLGTQITEDGKIEWRKNGGIVERRFLYANNQAWEVVANSIHTPRTPGGLRALCYKGNFEYEIPNITETDMKEEGEIEISGGVYLQTRENIMAAQEEWDEEDSAKDMDFSTCPYWVTTDDGQEPDGYMDIESALEDIVLR